MVKHHARRALQGLHNYLLDREQKNKERLEKAALKRQEKLQAMSVESAGEGGQVKALEGVKFAGTFGVSFPSNGGQRGRGNDDDMEDVKMEDEPEFKLCKSTRKQGMAVSKRDQMIVKVTKKDRKRLKKQARVKVVYGKKKMKD